MMTLAFKIFVINFAEIERRVLRQLRSSNFLVMAPDRYGVLASQHIYMRPQKRHYLPSATRMVRYVLGITVLLSVCAFWTRSNLASHVTRYFPIAADGI